MMGKVPVRFYREALRPQV